MAIPATRRIKLQGRTTAVRMQYMEGNVWRMWTSHDVDMRHGTFFEFHPDGRIERVTIEIDGIESRFETTLAETIE